MKIKGSESVVLEEMNFAIDNFFGKSLNFLGHLILNNFSEG